MLSSWTDTGIFWITLFVAIITVVATGVNYLIFRSQVDPEVVVYVTADERRPSLILLVIENIGKGVAKNVMFTLSQPLPAHAFDSDNAPPAPQMTAGPLIGGIPALGPGTRRVITWGKYGGLYRAIGDRVIIVTARYQADARSPWDPRDLTTESLVDVKSLEGTDVSDHNYDKAAAQHLKTIATAVDQLAKGWRTLRIEVQKPDEADDLESVAD